MAKIELAPFSLMAIGSIDYTESTAIIRLNKKYSEALLNLEEFSHCLFFVMHQGSIEHSIAKIKNIQMTTGEIKIDRCIYPPGTEVYDVKPYFPNEDRIKVYDGKFRTVQSDKEFISGSTLKPLHKEEVVPLILKPQGTFRMQKEHQWLELDKIEESLADGGYLRVYWWFHRFDKTRYRDITTCQPPYEHAPKCGMFATRSPIRPNPIASTVVKVLTVDRKNNRIEICGFDGFENSYIINCVAYEPKKEMVETYHLPKWLKHWPEWKNFTSPKEQDISLKLPPSGYKLLGRYMDEVGVQSDKNVDDKTINNLDTIKDAIVVKGAYQNNLKSVSITIPKNKITVMTGVSGSGKSSLAFDTVYTESQRQFMDIMGSDRNASYEKPKVDKVSGLMPSVAIEQKSLSNNPRSTVGTVTGIIEYLRMIYVTISTRHCPECLAAVEEITVDKMIHSLSHITEHSVVRLMSDEQVTNNSIVHECVSGSLEYLDLIKKVVPQLLDENNGILYVSIDGNESFSLQTKAYCYHCDRVFFHKTASLFSFNNPESMCPRCKGLGEEMVIDATRVISEPDKSILDGASKVWGDLRKHAKKPNANWMRGEVLALAYDMNIDLEVPYKNLPEKFKQQLLYGTGDRKVKLEYDTKGRSGIIERPAEGIMNIVTRLIENNTGKSSAMANTIDSFMSKHVCGLCSGERLDSEGRMVEISGIRYPQASAMTIVQLKIWLQGLYQTLPDTDIVQVDTTLKRMIEMLKKITDVGLSYLSLDRSIPTLSGGEGQRLRLASQFSTNLTNILYVLDEPSMGLHPYDYGFLKDKLVELRDRENTIVMVEHKKEMIEIADHIIDIGPGAGRYGGEVVAEGDATYLMNHQASITGPYLKNIKNPTEIMKTKTYKHMWSEGKLRLVGAIENNLQNLTVEIPLKRFVCVTGVSGSGKSSLISQTLCPAIKRELSLKVDRCGRYEHLEGAENLKELVEVTQKPIGRTPRSNPATYTGVFDQIRMLFSKQSLAKKLGLNKEHFSFNSKKGQCPECSGAGQVETKLNYMANIWTRCHICEGKRYLSKVLDVQYKNHNISEILELEISEAMILFKDEIGIYQALEQIVEVGLGYLKLGQSATTLSGGEAQRLKLATQLLKGKAKSTLYILDEPTTGLHYEDIKKLLKVLDALVDAGNSVIVIEHHIDIIRHSDYIIDLGPRGGDEGGSLVACGTPEAIALKTDSITGAVLNAKLKHD